MNRTPLLALFLPLALAPVGAVGSPAYAATTCHGLTVTIQGTPGGNVQGTPGNDVTDTNGAQGVSAGAGDDTICVTNAGTYSGVTAGDGNDYVETAQGHEAVVTLGAGSDTFLVRRRGSDCGPGNSGGRDQSTLIHGGPGDDILIGSEGPDVLTATAVGIGPTAAAASTGAWPRSGRVARRPERRSRDYPWRPCRST